jgi:hypothetical protein
LSIFSGTSAFSASIETKIIKHKFDKKKINKSARVGLGKNAVNSGSDKLNYRFTINPND